MDSLHDDIFGLQDGDSSPSNRAAVDTEAPEQYRNILCAQCKSLTKPTIKDLCQACRKRIAAVLAGGHASSSSSESEASSDSESEPQPGPEAGRLVIGDKIAVSSLGSQSSEADIGIPFPTNTSSSTWQTTTISTTTVTTESTHSRSRTRTRTRTVSQTRSHSTSRTRTVCEHEHELRKRRQREAEAKAAREQAEAAARAKFQSWLHERTQHRNWQRQMINYLRIKYPQRIRLSRFLASIRACPCHGDPDCPVQISLEYRQHLDLEEADRIYRLTDGRGIADWVPYLGARAQRFWVDREIEYHKSQAEAGVPKVGSNLNDGGGIEVNWLGSQSTYRVGGGELVLGLWRMRVVLECVWGRIPGARWRVRRMSGDSNAQNRGAIGDERAALLLYHQTSRGKRAMVKMDPIKGCLLWAGERNPCWALLPLLRDGGDVGMVWRWERFVWEPSGWNPFIWIWTKLMGTFRHLFQSVRRPVWCVFKRLGVGLGDVENQHHEEDGELD